MKASYDIGSEARIFESASGVHLFLADGSRIYDINAALARSLSQHVAAGEVPAELVDLIGSGRQRYIEAEAIAPPPVRSLSLSVAQACNLSCNYCYADKGHFGGRARVMPEAVARAAIDRVIAEAPAESNLLVGFMGGEPFVNAKLVHSATRYAAKAAQSAGLRARFSITTNATLLRNEDVALLAEYPFAVAVSLDGDRTANDRQRTIACGRGSAYDAALAGLSRLTSGDRPLHLSLRSTVMPGARGLTERLEHLLSLDVDEVGFAPVIVAPAHVPTFDAPELDCFLTEMIACGTMAKERALAGEIWPFSNFWTAMQQIHCGAHLPYPCGGGANYLSVSAEGKLYGCHRLIDDDDFLFGDVRGGTDHDARSAHLLQGHVDCQVRCRSCWARYLCGGGCYHEVARRGRISCDYVRGWLDFCLSAYAELSHRAPWCLDAMIHAREVRPHD